MVKGEYCGICELIAGKLEDQIKDKTNEVCCWSLKKLIYIQIIWLV